MNGCCYTKTEESEERLMAEIYYADDEQDIRESVSAFLRAQGHEVTAYDNGDSLLAAFRERPADLVILDIMMPGTDGIGILTKIREFSTVPVILLTAKDTDSDYLAGISMGSDDYLTKPFNPMILAAKVTALLRRVRYGQEDEKKAQVEKEEIKCGNVRFDAKRHGVLVNEQELKLTPTELKFLTFMMRHFGEAVSKETLLNEIWGMDSEVQSRVADETNRRLRRKMTAAGADVYIQTVWGYGFKLTEIPE